MIHCLAPVMRPSAARVRMAPASEPRAGLGQRERGQLLAGGQRRDALGDLLVAAVVEDRQRARARVTATVTPTPASARESSSSTST